VFAVPGSPLDPRAEGTNGLIKQGATLVTTAADIISVLQPILGRPMEIPAPAAEAESSIPVDTDTPTDTSYDVRTRIVGLLGPTPAAVDDLVRLSGSPAALVRMVLLELEVAGRLVRRDGGLVAMLPARSDSV
jgi:DNA processing protein